MRFLLSLTLWATLAFLPCWFVSHPYERAIAEVAGRLAAPAGREIELVDVEVFYPFDLGIYVALCLASGWATRAARVRAIGLGLPILVVLEIVSLAVPIRILLGVSSGAAGPGDQDYRMALGIVRMTGLVAATAVWLCFLGRERISAAEARLGA